MNPLRRWLAKHERWVRRLRFAAVAVVVSGGAWLILDTVHEHYPIDQWLFWRYASYWLWVVLFGAACLSAGHRLSRWLSPRPAFVSEHLVTSMALGVFTFFLGTFVAGLLGLFGPVFAVAWPVVLVASGGWPLFRYVRRALRHMRHAGALRPRLSLFHAALFGYGLLAVAAVYFAMLTPENAAYDAQWYHLPLAEHYAAQGGIARFPEGWFPGAGPQLASILYTWAFLVPGAKLFDHVLLSAHLEFFLFLWTLAAVPPLVRRLLHGRRVPLSWVATFLFPGLMLYDSSLCLGADHVAAFWAIPIFLVLMRFWREPRPRRAVALALLIAGATLTKYTAFMLVGLPIGAAVLRSIWIAAVRRFGKLRDRGAALASALALPVFAAVGVIATTPHWLKNWIWYGDPVYPILHARLPVHPWTPESTAYYHAAITDTFFRPESENPIRSTFEVLFTFAFEPHNWPQFHGKVPVFGFLFTISTGILLFLRRTGRTWGLVLATWVAIATWYWVHAQDRYLQAALPWMVAVTAAVLVSAWRTHWANRVLLAGLVAVQVVWGGDVYFFRTHTMIHDSPAKATIDMIAAGHAGKYDKRLEPYGSWYDVGKSLPPGAKVVVHEEHIHLGLQAMSVNDWPGIQGGLNYGRLGSVRGLHDQFETWGVTHLGWTHQRSLGYDSLAGDLLFFDYATQVAEGEKAFGGRRVAQVPEQAPEASDNLLVLYLGCPKTYKPGLYDLSAMIVPERGDGDKVFPQPKRPAPPKDATALREMANEASYLVHDARCQKSVDRGVFKGFVKVAKRSKRIDLYVKRK